VRVYRISEFKKRQKPENQVAKTVEIDRMGEKCPENGKSGPVKLMKIQPPDEIRNSKHLLPYSTFHFRHDRH
jgi:hypothetical protein